MSINLKDTTYLLNNGFIMVTKKGTAWRCGKGYRKDWSKLIGKEVILHGSSYTLTQRVKKNSKWYLVYTDGQNNYTELQTKALHNKGMAKDTIIEVAKRVIAGLLTAPKELIDILVEQVDIYIKKENENKQQEEQQKYTELLANPANYTKKGTLRKRVLEDWECYKEYKFTPKYSYNQFISRCMDIYNEPSQSQYINDGYSQWSIFSSIKYNCFNPTTKLGRLALDLYFVIVCGKYKDKQILRKLKRAYHPDNKVTGNEEVFKIIEHIA